MKTNQILLLISCIAFSTLTFSSASPTDKSVLRNSNNQLGVQLLWTNVDYTETGNGIFGTPKGTLDTEKNNVPGIGLSWSIMKHFLFNNDYMEFKYSHSTDRKSVV